MTAYTTLAVSPVQDNRIGSTILAMLGLLKLTRIAVILSGMAAVKSCIPTVRRDGLQISQRLIIQLGFIPTLYVMN